ncbi:MAG: hypothetical protein H7A36_02570 [Chlamydiales bacterium]|nr:hypothetical protein [Chlamydiales bacterium]
MKRYSWKRSTLVIVCSILITLTLYAFFQKRGDRPVVAIVQSPQNEKLQTTCLAEIIELSVDHPISFAHFPVKEAEKRLCSHAIFQEAYVQKMRPNVLYIEYALRTPVAQLGSQTNTAVDAEGNFFPLAPFYKPRALPLYYPGKNDLEIFRELITHNFKMIDLSQIHAPTLGKKQIVVKTQNDALLRLSVKRYKKELEWYSRLEKKIEVSGKIIDLRIPKVAYIDE